MAKLSACVEMLFKPEHDDFVPRIAGAAAAGMDAVEFWSWRNKDLDAVARALGDTGLPLTGFLVDPRQAIVDPATHADFIVSVRESVGVARRLGARALIVVTGDARDGVSHAAQHDAIVAALRAAAPIAADGGVTLVLEPLNTALDHRGYFLNSTVEGLDIVGEVGSPAVRLLYDLYHSVMMDEQPATVLAKRGNLVGHVHVADAPGRHEPGTGTIDFPVLLQTIKDAGYGGPIGLEFRPTAGTVAALEVTRARFAAR
jgi:hydroxypyruvate isomerase